MSIHTRFGIQEDWIAWGFEPVLIYLLYPTKLDSSTVFRNNQVRVIVSRGMFCICLEISSTFVYESYIQSCSVSSFEEVSSLF